MVNITKYDPIRSLIGFPRWFDDADEYAQRGLKIYEDEKSIKAEAVVAGVPAKNVDVNIEDGVLTIKASVTDEDKKSGEYTKTSYQYYYTCALSGGEWDKTEAEVEDGVVTITIPKAESAKPRKIAVKAKNIK